MVFQNDILAGASGAGGSYQIDQSIRFNTPDSAYMYRTPGTTGNRKTWTYSLWIKRSALSSNRLFATGGIPNTSNANMVDLYFSGNTLNAFMYNGATYANVATTAQFRDPSAWYHVVYVVDTTQATSTDRIKIYVNSVQQITTGSFPTLNYDTHANQSGILNSIGRYLGNGGAPDFAGYLAETHMIDGQALTPTSFGEFNINGVWVPKAFTGTYGTNGFYITGENSAALGTDYSGNSNTFTSSGLTSADQVTDTPTDNYATLNVVETVNSTAPTIAEGNTYYSRGSTAPGWISSTQWLPDSGAYYWETDVSFSLAGAPLGIGVVNNTRLYNQDDAGVDMWFVSGYDSANLYARANGTTVSTSYISANPLSTNRLAHAYDGDTGKYWVGIVSGGSITWGNPGAGVGDPVAGTNPFVTLAQRVRPFVGQWNTAGATRTITATFYFDSTKWNATTPPTGFVALSTVNLPAPAIKDGSKYFDANKRTGTGAAFSVTGIGFQPGLVWTKGRSGATSHAITDSLFGVGKYWSSNGAAAYVSDAQAVTSFNADGFSGGTAAIINTNAATYVDWLFRKSVTAGIDIVQFSGNSTNRTIAHSLGVAPSMLLVKRDGANGGVVWHSGLTSAAYYLALNTTAAQASDATAFNSTVPTSAVFSVGTNNNTNATGTNNMLALLFAEVEGFSKFGKYTGNGSTDGPFIFTGFKPAFVMFKKTSATDSWEIFDNTRPGYNATGLGLLPNTAASESTGRNIDILSNGIKQRNANGTTNEGGQTYIYMAFAENPFGGTGVAPATAR